LGVSPCESRTSPSKTEEKTSKLAGLFSMPLINNLFF